ncbi:MAG: Mrp/NBP35 family ATP-binding protein [Nitrososphaeria archaeon]|nr:Mrp/NBP35 family ATP-binding protein [Nitrososphaeria archaeon]
MTDLEMIKRFQDTRKRVRENMGKVKHKIAVISGKGGVGKSTFTVNLAIAFAAKGHMERVGILDADFHGPSVPKMLGAKGQMIQSDDGRILPVIGPMGIRVVSTEFILPDENTPVIWRGPLKMNAIRDFLSEISWGELDFLLIDLPPGTGDEPLSIAQLLPDLDGVIVITIPSQVSQLVVKKSVNFARRLNLPVIGIVENMSGFICPNCGTKVDIFQAGGGRKIAEELNIPFLGSIPIDQRICEDADNGKPFILEHKYSPATEAFMEIVDKIEKYLEAQDMLRENS